MQCSPRVLASWLPSLHLVPVTISHLAVHAGENMVYAERMGKGLLAAIGLSLINTVLPLLLATAAKIPFIRKMLPTPGDGPSREVMESGCFALSCYALSEKTDDSEPVRVKSFIKVCPFQLVQHQMSPSRYSAEGMSGLKS